MKRVTLPARGEWKALCARPEGVEATAMERVTPMMADIQQRGDEAVRQYTRQFDGHDLEHFAVTPEAMQGAGAQLSDALKEAIDTAATNIRRFHQAQQREELRLETQPGIQCRRRAVPIGSVGLYVPGGSAPLFSSVLMLAIPAAIAGCREIILCSPPQPDGQLHPAVLWTAWRCGVQRAFRVGGAQAIAAMTYGTASIPKVDKLFGPGNSYVTAAKTLAQREGVAIDMPAGPSEVLVIADDSADPAFVAADLLAQAEHGPDSQVILLTDSATLLEQSLAEVERQLESLPRNEIARAALQHSLAVQLPSMEEAVAFSNLYAPEHLILICRELEKVADQITDAGSVFMGPYTPEALGDYASGTNHTLPTAGHARAYSGVSLDSFMKYITFQEATAEGLHQLGPVVEAMAEAEQLIAHQRSVSIRLSRSE